MTLCVVDVESTGLDPRIHQPYEVAYWRDDADHPTIRLLGHTLQYADPQALAISRYWERGHLPFTGNPIELANLADDLRGVTLVGSNPAFDAAMLTRHIGIPVWHYRLINVADAAMWLYQWDRPKGLVDVVAALVGDGYDIPEPDHSAEGDVRCTRAVFYALRDARSRL